MRFRTITAKTQKEKILAPDTNNGLFLKLNRYSFFFNLISIHFPFNKSFPFGFNHILPQSIKSFLCYYVITFSYRHENVKEKETRAI